MKKNKIPYTEIGGTFEYDGATYIVECSNDVDDDCEKCAFYNKNGKCCSFQTDFSNTRFLDDTNCDGLVRKDFSMVYYKKVAVNPHIDKGGLLVRIEINNGNGDGSVVQKVLTTEELCAYSNDEGDRIERIIDDVKAEVLKKYRKK